MRLGPECRGFFIRTFLVNIGILKFAIAVFSAKASAILRLRQVVQNLWPRAQVKAFGSYVSGLSLPDSDVDLVIYLPKVWTPH